VKPAVEDEMVTVECKVCICTYPLVLIFLSFLFFLSSGLPTCLPAYPYSIVAAAATADSVILSFPLQIVHAGRRLCLLTGIMRREKDGAVVATCEHNKYNVDAEDSKM
jgi:acyl-coenzyme A thioesterase 13